STALSPPTAPSSSGGGAHGTWNVPGGGACWGPRIWGGEAAFALAGLNAGAAAIGAGTGDVGHGADCAGAGTAVAFGFGASAEARSVRPLLASLARSSWRAPSTVFDVDCRFRTSRGAVPRLKKKT